MRGSRAQVASIFLAMLTQWVMALLIKVRNRRAGFDRKGVKVTACFYVG